MSKICLLWLQIFKMLKTLFFTLSIYTKIHQGCWKHDGFCHDVTSIILGIPAISKWTPIMAYPTNNIPPAPIISKFDSLAIFDSLNLFTP